MTTISVVGGSGYAGGELVRLLLDHPEVRLGQVTSRSLAGKPVSRAHPNLRGVTAALFSDPAELEPCDLLVLALPHGQAARRWDELAGAAPRVVDMSADFRLADADRYEKHYGPHPRPELLGTFAYGIAELNRDAIRLSNRVATGGCNATVSLLALTPLFEADAVHRDRTVIDVKVGSSEGGAEPNEGSHHPVRRGVVRPYKAVGHRHTGEIEALLSSSGPAQVHLTATAVDMVRGAAATAHVFLTDPLSERDLWSIYRERYGSEPFVRIVNERRGPYRLPEPKLLAGTNYCDIGFERDPWSNRVVVVAAIDNLVKGAAGQVVQAINLMMGWDERAGLTFPGLHPV